MIKTPSKQCNEQESGFSLRDKSHVIGGWFRPLAFVLTHDHL